MSPGRPLRFLVMVLGGWFGLRAMVLWPTGEAVSVVPGIGRAFTAVPAHSAAPALPVMVRRVPTSRIAAPALRVARASQPVSRVDATGAITGPTSIPTGPPSTETAALASPGQALLPPPPRSVKDSSSRWSGSAWFIARPSGTGGGLGASQLGGSQAGARVAYALGAARRLAIVGRVATPLEGGGRGAALGVEWRPARLPVRVFAEQRFALDDGRGGPSAGVTGGIVEGLVRGVRLEAYGQAGVIKRDRVEGFADGAARVTRMTAALGLVTLDVGAGAWGGAQRGAERLDLGPTLGVSVPVEGRSFRLTLDYRARVAGRARPGSGPALSLGADF